MACRTAQEVPTGLVEQLLDGPVLRPERIAAGRARLAGDPVDALALAGAVVADVCRGAAFR